MRQSDGDEAKGVPRSWEEWDESVFFLFLPLERIRVVGGCFAQSEARVSGKGRG